MWSWLSLQLTLCPAVWHWLCDIVGTMGWAEAAKNTFQRESSVCEVLVLSAAWLCASACNLEGGPLDAFWPSTPLSLETVGQLPALCSHPSFLTLGKLLGRAHVAVRCVPPAPGAYPNLLNLAVLGGSREDTETAVQAPWGAWILTLLVVCSKAEQQPAPSLAWCSLSTTPDTKQALHTSTPKWLTDTPWQRYTAKKNSAKISKACQKPRLSACHRTRC